jgi:hypothetical protein
MPRIGGQDASDIKLVDVASGHPFPSAPSGSVLLSSVPLGWRGIIVEWHRLKPQEQSITNREEVPGRHPSLSRVLVQPVQWEVVRFALCGGDVGSI